LELLLNKGADINAENSFGQTALMKAVSEENKLLVDLLLKKGAKVQIMLDPDLVAKKDAEARAKHEQANNGNERFQERLLNDIEQAIRNIPNSVQK
jgi:ankyrin repeat protein